MQYKNKYQNPDSQMARYRSVEIVYPGNFPLGLTKSACLFKIRNYRNADVNGKKFMPQLFKSNSLQMSPDDGCLFTHKPLLLINKRK